MERFLDFNGTKIAYSLEYKQIKNINLRIRRDGSVYVSAPRKVSLSVIEAFLMSKATFILKAADRAKSSSALFAPCDGGDCFYLGNRFTLCFASGKTHIDGDTIYTAGLKDFEAWESQTAHEIILPLCREKYPLFADYCPVFPDIRFRKMTSKWGVCRPTEGRITFNARLVRLPVPCIEYVICHEFVHFKHPDHSRLFYAELASVMPDWKKRRELLNRY